jgi:hypothetical protein
MASMYRPLFWALLLLVSGAAWAKAAEIPAVPGWRQLEEGLAVGDFTPPRGKPITVVRVDLGRFELRLLAAAELNEPKRTAKQWSEAHGLAAAINAGMYQSDGKTHVGYMKNFDYVNNPSHGRAMRAFLAFNPVDGSAPPVRIIDRRCESFEKLGPRYHTLIQGIRMIGCRQKNVWKDRAERWSIAAFGMDAEGHALLLFSQGPYSPHDFIEALLKLPVKIESAMYLEGGSEASLYVAAGGEEIEKFGTHGSGVLGRLFRNNTSWPIPNVIGVVRKGS